MKKKIISLLIICFVLTSCQQEKNQTNHQDAELLTDQTELELKLKSTAYGYDTRSLPGNWFVVKFKDFTIYIDYMDLKSLTPSEYNEIYQDTAIFELMPGSDALMNKNIEISQSKFDKITLFE